jgi:hypothetical protein
VGLAENKALVRRYYQEVLAGRDRDLLARLLDSPFVSHVSGGPTAGAGGLGRPAFVRGVLFGRGKPG